MGLNDGFECWRRSSGLNRTAADTVRQVCAFWMQADKSTDLRGKVILIWHSNVGKITILEAMHDEWEHGNLLLLFAVYLHPL